MTYLKPKHQIPMLLHDNAEMFKGMKLNLVKIEEVVEAFTESFTNDDQIDAQHIVNCLKMLHHGAVAALQDVQSKTKKALIEEIKEKHEYSFAEAAKELGIGLSTIKLYIREGKINVKRYSPRVIKITQAEINRYREQFDKPV